MAVRIAFAPPKILRPPYIGQPPQENHDKFCPPQSTHFKTSNAPLAAGGGATNYARLVRTYPPTKKDPQEPDLSAPVRQLSAI